MRNVACKPYSLVDDSREFFRPVRSVYLCHTSFNPHNFMELEVKDSNGNLLKDGDSVTLIKDLKVRGSSAVLKRGTKVKNIRLTEDPEEVEGKIEGSMMVLKACFLKKA